MAGVKFPRLGFYMKNCAKCDHFSSSLHYQDGKWVCRPCYVPETSLSPMFEYGHENPIDAKGSTAHVRDIKDRRYHHGEKRLFYYSKELGKTYFFPK